MVSNPDFVRRIIEEHADVIIEAQLPQQCDTCGTVAELRPYGPNGEAICFDCAMKDEATTRRMAGIVLFGDKP